jgi:hypothetical protein
MATPVPATRDDRVLRYTRVLSLVIIPFLLVAFVVLYLFPGHAQQLFAWTIRPTMSAMMLASVYIGGAYFFARVLREPRWAAVKTGFLSVTLFASLLGATTIVHWDRFNHRHVAFWLWATLYFVTPFLVFAAWLLNRRCASPPRPDEGRIGPVARVVIGLAGVLAVAQGLSMVLDPLRVIGWWPWLLTPLTCRVMGALFCLGSAGIGVFLDPRWVSTRLLLQVEALMLALILVAAVRARAQFYPDRIATWLMLGGFVAVLVGTAVLWFSMEARSKASDDGQPASGAHAA